MCTTASYIVHPRASLSWLDPGAFGTLGVGAGFALGAATVRPGTQAAIVDLVGGRMRLRAGRIRHLRAPRRAGRRGGRQRCGQTQIAREQLKMVGDDVGTVLSRTAYHEVARGFGAQGLEIRRSAEVEPVLKRARELAAGGRPVLINVWLDKSEFREGSLST